MSAYPVSPAVAFRETDASAILESGAATAGSIAGKFSWGPINERVRVAGEDELVARFGKPTDSAYIDFLLASSFLAYSGALDVVRIGSHSTTKNAVDGGTSISILNLNEYEAGVPSTCSFFGKYAGTAGNALTVVTCGSADQYRYVAPGAFTFTVSNTVNYAPSGSEVLTDFIQVGDFLSVDGESYPIEAVGTTTVTLGKVYVGSLAPVAISRLWKYAPLFGIAPAANEFHLAIVDTTGYFNTAGFVLEYATLSTISTAKNADGTTRFYKEYLKQFSSYLYAGDLTLNFGTDLTANAVQLSGGVDAFSSLGLANYVAGYDLFKNPEEVFAPLIIAGDAVSSGATLAKYLIQNIAEVRRDALVFVSPQLSSVLTKGQEANLVIADRNTIGSSGYAAMDSNWKYTYDRYNDKFRWIPCSADHAGRYALVDREKNTWESGAGLDAIIKGAVKLAWNPDRNARDLLYPNYVNPIFSKPGFGPVLFGHKTLLGHASPLDRIPNRRILNEMEGIITKSAQALLFKVNNETSQRRFYSIVEPYLRDIKGQGGIIDFFVLADATVNTPDIVSQNKFAAKIYIKLNGFAEFILIDFTAVGANTNFNEIIGQK